MCNITIYYEYVYKVYKLKTFLSNIFFGEKKTNKSDKTNIINFI